MRIKGSKAKKGNFVKCPKCKYRWRTKQKKKLKKGGYICCSRCKRYFRK